MKVRYAVRVFAIKDDKIMCIRYKDINKDRIDRNFFSYRRRYKINWKRILHNKRNIQGSK